MSPMFTRLIAVFSVFIALSSCQNENPVKQEYESIEMASSKISGARIFVLDSAQSEINWVISRPDAKVLKGVLHPRVGSILVEKERVLAGFWKGPLFESKLIEMPSGFDPQVALKALKDSNRRLNRTEANQFYFDLAQVNRQIIRSDYKVNSEVDSKERVSHIFQGNLDVADSVLYVSLPVFLEIGEKQVKISGRYRLNSSDFGVFSKPSGKNEMESFQPAAELNYRLIFNYLAQ
ncbi:MAG TPA: hypothetical protein PKY12_03350 [Catalimonadaceae bacterium]|nr:hypothetical protein [Catalimonadaceae bacterium]